MGSPLSRLAAPFVATLPCWASCRRSREGYYTGSHTPAGGDAGVGEGGRGGGRGGEESYSGVVGGHGGVTKGSLIWRPPTWSTVCNVILMHSPTSLYSALFVCKTVSFQFSIRSFSSHCYFSQPPRSEFTNIPNLWTNLKWGGT